MKINAINKINRSINLKNILLLTPLLLLSPKVSSIERMPGKDTFVKEVNKFSDDNIQNDSIILSPAIKVANDTIYPAVVIDKSENMLYSYDLDTVLDSLFTVGLGKSTTPTKTGLRVITSIEDYPYTTAPKSTKRRKAPNDYGSKVICLETVDHATGKTVGSNGQFIHGTNKPDSIGKNQSLGCIRMNNDDVNYLADRLFVGQYVLIKE